MSIKADMATSAVTPLSTEEAGKERSVGQIVKDKAVVAAILTWISHRGLTGSVVHILELFHGYAHPAGWVGVSRFTRWRLAAFRHGKGGGGLRQVIENETKRSTK